MKRSRSLERKCKKNRFFALPAFKKYRL